MLLLVNFRIVMKEICLDEIDILAFNQARGHQIEKYIDDLRRRTPVK